MTTNFPAGLDDATHLPPATTIAAQNEDTFPHSGLHGNADDAIIALETKLGINSSTDPSSIDYKVNNIAITQLPVGTTSNTVAAGDQAANLIAQLPTVDTDDHTKATFSTVNNITYLAMANIVGPPSNVTITGGSITGITDLHVADGGTGAGTFTQHGILLGQGTSAITATAVMTNGQLLVGQSAADPVPKTISGDISIDQTGATTLSGTANVESIIRANSLDQLTAPAANVSWNSKKITSLATGTVSTDAVNYGQLASSVFGDGSDGAVTFDGVATVLGITPTGGNAYGLLRDIYCTNITVNSGITLYTNGFKIYATGTVTGPGTIKTQSGIRDGGGFGTGVAGTVSTASTVGTGQSGQGGATGVGSSTSNLTSCLGGRGGNGGNGTSGAGGTAGTVTAPAANLGTLRALPQAVTGLLMSASQLTPIVPGFGTGGASGAGDGTNKGGAGGASGGVLILAANHIASTNAITLSAAGGNGESPAVGNVGGGGGGGGGIVIVISKEPSNATTSAAGGTHGNAHGTGTNGTDGSAGSVYLISS